MTTRTRLLAVRASLTAALAEVDALLAIKPYAPPWSYDGDTWMRSPSSALGGALATVRRAGASWWAIYPDGEMELGISGSANSIFAAMVEADAALSTTHNITTPPPTPAEIAAIERTTKDPS